MDLYYTFFGYKLFFSEIVSIFLGKLSLPIYLSQVAGIRLTEYFFAQHTQGEQLVAAFVLTILLALVTMLLAAPLGKKRS